MPDVNNYYAVVDDSKMEKNENGKTVGAGMATKLKELGFNVEIIEYITPHQAKNIKHPEGVTGIQYNQKFDWIVTQRGIIDGINKLFTDWSNFFSVLGVHANGDNVDTVKRGEDARKK